MNPLWIGIIFLINSAWLSGEPQFDSKGRMIEPLDVTFGLNDEYFKSEEICWQYFDNHPSFKILDVYNRNHYDIESKIKRYEIENVGTAYVTCKPKHISLTPFTWLFKHYKDDKHTCNKAQELGITLNDPNERCKEHVNREHDYRIPDDK